MTFVILEFSFESNSIDYSLAWNKLVVFKNAWEFFIRSRKCASPWFLIEDERALEHGVTLF